MQRIYFNLPESVKAYKERQEQFEKEEKERRQFGCAGILFIIGVTFIFGVSFIGYESYKGYKNNYEKATLKIEQLKDSLNFYKENSSKLYK